MDFLHITASLQKRGSRFYVYFYDPARTPARKSFPLGAEVTTKRLAEQLRHELLGEVHAGRFDPWTHRAERRQPSRASTLDGALERFLQERTDLRKATRRAYEGAVSGLAQGCPPGLGIAHLSEAMVRSYVFSGSVSAATQAHRFRHLRAFFNWAVESGIVRLSPMARMKPPKVGHKEGAFFMPDDLERLKQAVQAEEGRGRPVMWVWNAALLGLLTGMRRGELCHLRWRDVDLRGEYGSLTVRSDEAFKTKSGHDRRLPVAGALRDLLLDLRMAHFGSGAVDGEAFVLRGRRGGRLNDEAFGRAFKGLIRLAGLSDDLHVHSLRHTHASWLAMGGTETLAVSRLLGHSSVRVTERYSHFADGAMREDLSRTFSGVQGLRVKEAEYAQGLYNSFAR